MSQSVGGLHQEFASPDLVGSPAGEENPRILSDGRVVFKSCA